MFKVGEKVYFSPKGNNDIGLPTKIFTIKEIKNNFILLHEYPNWVYHKILVSENSQKIKDILEELK